MIERKLNRMPGYDYSKNGWYYVTIDCRFMKEWFGKIQCVGTGHCPVPTMKLNRFGLVAKKFWINIPKINPEIVLDEFIVMPNHMHGIIQINNNLGGTGHSPFRTDKENEKYGKLSKIINGFKNVVTKEIRYKFGLNDFQWQRSFYDEIIRDETALNRIRKYIIGNPKNYDAKSR